ncbi:MAG: c-type cytochrome, partial [Planctomycetes bacterium]|nr:c-type cytochrome [Planctomycetota bacterium]
DGRFDRSTVFVDNLPWPTGLLWFDGGLFVCSAPDLLYCKDTDGDGRADVREVVVTGFIDSHPNRCPNSLRWNLDNQVEGMAGGGLLEPVRWNRLHPDQKRPPVQSRGRDFIVHPRTGELRLTSGGSQYGMTFDKWGCKFESSNSAPIEMVMYEDRYVARNPFLAAPGCRKRIWVDGSTVYRTSPVEPWRIIRTEMRVRGVFSGPVEGGGTPAGYFTSACGVTIYTGDALPVEFQGNAFVGEGAGNLVHRMRLKPNGVAYTAHRVEQKKEFLTSDETWFRPIQFANAPDGCLYVADMYREVFEHPDAIPPSVKKYIDLNAGNDRGRIYRIVPPNFHQPPRVHLGRLSTVELVSLLAHPNGWHRDTARRLLYERQDPAAIEPLTRLAADSPSPVGRMQALYALAGQNALTPDLVLARLNDPHPRVREHAVRLAERVLAGAPAVRAKLCQMAGDEDVRVRYQLAFTLGDVPGPLATEALAAFARQDGGDPWTRLAILTSCVGRSGDLVFLLASDSEWARQSTARGLLEALAEQTGRQAEDDQIARALQAIDRLSGSASSAAKAVMRGLSKGLAKSGSPWLARLKTAGSEASQLLADLVQQALKRAQDTNQPIERRVQAIRSLAMASFDEAEPVLTELLDSHQPQQVQIAAIQALSRFDREEVGEMIVEAWSAFTPTVRGEAAEALFSRQSRLAVLLDAVEQKQIAPSQLTPSRIQFLRSHPDQKIRHRAEKLLASARVARREQVIADYRDALKLKGDAQRGKSLFKKHCSTCHRLEGVGYDLGLPLMTVKSRGPEGILMQVLDPNREVNPAYLDYMIVTQDGRVVTGIITAETATSITLTRAEGQSDTVLRKDIELIKSTGLSLMPEGLEKDISKQDLADLIAYLMAVQ